MTGLLPRGLIIILVGTAHFTAADITIDCARANLINAARIN